MNIEIANRLVELRKKSGLSQEELASKLGLSRQAVSKWERAEASPDTDNLICLAKLYNVSLDELLNTEEPVDEIVEETKEINKEKEEGRPSKKEKIVIDDNGIHVYKTNGEERVLIDDEGIRVYHQDGSEKVNIGNGTIRVDGVDYKEKRKAMAINGIVTGVMFSVVTVLFLALGFAFPSYAWALGWPIFMLPIVVSSIINAIQNRKWCDFALPVFIAMVYCEIGMIGTKFSGSVPSWLGWHPWWIMFLLIPVYYTIFGAIDKHIRRSALKNGNIFVENREDLEDAKNEVEKAKNKLAKAKDEYAKAQDEDERNSTEKTKEALEKAASKVEDAAEDLEEAVEDLEKEASKVHDRIVDAKVEK
ncbi:MAG: helix-turn-helix domain-containing protein [Bacilli bacterium]|nr:helix-turn-helix domain-containing protein [Bacilli bacterium]